MAKPDQSQLNLSAGVQSYTNTGSGAGTGYYINLGGIKLCWGQTGNFSDASGNHTVSLPPGFFTSVQSAIATPYNSNVAYTINSITTSLLQVFISGATSSSGIIWFVIGT